MSPLYDEAMALLAGLRQTGAEPSALAQVLAGVVRGQPDHAAARIALAHCLWNAGDSAGAIAEYRQAAARHPDDAAAAALLGIALVRADVNAHGPGLAEGRAVLADIAIRSSEIADARLWLGVAQGQLGDLEAALATLDTLQPVLLDEPNLHMTRAHALLAMGRLRAGWPEYAWRWRRAQPLGARTPENPLRRPDPASWRGRTVLLFAEQGFGDTLQCLRYVALVQAAGARVVLEVQPALARLARTMPGIAVIAAGAPPPAHDLTVPLFHLPWAFDTVLDTIPQGIPYLHPAAADVAHWHTRLADLPGLRVGLVWSGDPRPEQPDAHQIDRRRSLGLAPLAPLAAVPGVSFVSLQIGAGAAQAADPPPGMVLHDCSGALHDFAETAALMTALDLVISVDSAPAHLAGALGREIWLLNRFDSCWRWLRDRDDSPWYPTLRQFRQAAPGDWDGAIQAVAAALAERSRRDSAR